ncbi:ABC transporter substrate-binding protein [Patescibacteria group bacterium]|nr:ABC transporter substrate-binding protein [Patescibacteria group bacterium]
MQEGKKRNVLTVIVLLIVLIGGAWFFAGNLKTSVTGPVRIGVIHPFTGDAAVYGEPMLRVLNLAAEKINAEGGIDGYPIEFVVEDGKCDGTAAANAAQKLVNIDKVEVIIGGFCSGEALAAEPITTAAGVALFSSSASNPKLSGISPLFVRNYPSDSSQGVVLADAAIANGMRKIAVLQEQTDYAAGIYEVFDAQIQENGGTTHKEEYTTDSYDFRTSIAKLQAERPDGLFVIANSPVSAERIFKQLKEMGWESSLLVSDVIAGDPTLVATHADLLEGAYAAEFGVDDNNPKFREVIDAYSAKYMTEPPFQAYVQTGYDAVFLIAEAIKEVGYDGEKIAAWLRDVESWQGASGTLTINSNGDPEVGHRLEVIKSGKIEVVGE